MRDEQREDLLSAYIDDLNDEKKPSSHQDTASDNEAARLMATVRTIRSLRECAMPDATFPDELVARLRTQDTALRGPSAGDTADRGRSRRRRPWAWVGAVAAMLIVTLSFGLLSSPRVDAATVAAQAELVVRNPGAAGLVGYSGTINSFTKGVQEVYFLAPDKLLTRRQSTGALHGVNGSTVWDHDPQRQAGLLTVGDPAPFGPTNSLVPSETQFAEFLRAREQHDTVTLVSSKEQVAGRQAWLLSFTPKPGEPFTTGLDVWVDQQTYLILRSQPKGEDGTALGGGWEFTSLTLSPPEASLFAPSFPAGTSVTKHHYAPLQQLIAESGLHLSEPRDLPSGWTITSPHLTVMPRSGTAPDHVSLSWYYQEGETTTLSVTVATPLPTEPGKGEFIKITPALLGTYYHNEITGWPGVFWTKGDIFYRLEGPGLSSDQLTSLARAMN